jgi:hypothetical protein
VDKQGGCVDIAEDLVQAEPEHLVEDGPAVSESFENLRYPWVFRWSVPSGRSRSAHQNGVLSMVLFL